MAGHPTHFMNVKKSEMPREYFDGHVFIRTPAGTIKLDRIDEHLFDEYSILLVNMHVVLRRTTFGRLKCYSLSRIIMNAPIHLQVDHRNHDPLDNRRCNLRLCTGAENHRNASKIKGTKCRYKGVYKQGNHYQVQITFESKRIHVGSFADERIAALAYNKKATELYGNFACLNDVV